MALILVVDDVPALAEQYAYDLKRVGNYETLIAHGGEAALKAIDKAAVDCIILDLEMPGVDGFEVLRSLKKDDIDVPVIVYTGTGNYERCVRAVQLGAYSFIDKSESMERVVQEVEHALERTRMVAEIKSLKQDLGKVGGLIGSSDVMQKLKDQISRLAPVPSSALILGESGTGKELVARALHSLGGDESRPFVAVNCAALPENLVESELFGHERGAFTGANRTRKGAFLQAAGGTIFLDEVGEMPLPAQAKLLRVLEQREVVRVGGDKPLKVTARVVAATNRDLAEESEAGRFRADLFYRLNVHILNVPPLRDRRSDVPELANHFLALICRRFGIRRKRLSTEAMDALMAHEWKRNNVRELRNIVERLIISSDDDVIQVDEMPVELQGVVLSQASVPAQTYQERKTEAERQIIISALEENAWHISNTAKALGLADHASLLKIMRRLNVKRTEA